MAAIGNRITADGVVSFDGFSTAGLATLCNRHIVLGCALYGLAATFDHGTVAPLGLTEVSGRRQPRVLLRCTLG